MLTSYDFLVSIGCFHVHVFFDFFFRILSILTNAHGERGEDLKEINNGVYPKGPNSWIHTIRLDNGVFFELVAKSFGKS